MTDENNNDNVVAIPKRGPGRPPRQEVEKKERRRRGRVGLERNMKLVVPPDMIDPAYEYRWFNNVPGRLDQKTKLDDWDVVQDPDSKGNEGEGSPYKRGVGWDGGGNRLFAYLCRKPKEYYEADKKEEQDAIKDQEDAVLDYQQGAGAQGLNPQAPEDHAYIPGKR